MANESITYLTPAELKAEAARHVSECEDPSCGGCKPRKIKRVTCGCCTNGCTCPIHQDIPRGIRAKTCATHQGLAR